MPLDEPILKINDELYDEMNEEAANVLALYHVVVNLLEEIKADPKFAAEVGITQNDVDALENAFRAGRRLLDHGRFEAFKRDGWMALPAEDRHVIREAFSVVDVLVDAEIDAPPKAEDYLLTGPNVALGRGA